jgi:uncharacterized membrane protein YkvA (DUF1232 family)
MTNSKRQLKRTMKNCFWFIPRLLKLTSRLLLDPRVSKADKAILAATIIYTLTPIDLLADFIPFFGLVDDSFLMALALTRLLYRAGEAPLREHWDGEGDIVALISTMRQVSELLLPRRLHQRLLGKVQSQSAD